MSDLDQNILQTCRVEGIPPQGHVVLYVLQPDKKKRTVVVESGTWTALEPFEEGSCPESGQVEAVTLQEGDHKATHFFSRAGILPPMVTPQINASRIISQDISPHAVTPVGGQYR